MLLALLSLKISRCIFILLMTSSAFLPTAPSWTAATAGEDFTIAYNALDTFLEDEYSRYYTSKNDALKNDLKTNIEKQLGSTDDTWIEFSGGKWKWYNSEGSLINDGIYKESEEYRGLIALFVTEESANPDGTAVSMSPEFLYLDSDGKIWVPYMMKAD